MIYWILSIGVLLFIIVLIWLFFNQKKFGQLPKGERLKRIQKSRNYKEGAFQNLNFTPQFAEGITYWKVLKSFLFENNKKKKPKEIIPSIKTDLTKLDSSKDVMIWFGHSSYLLQIDGKKYLVDPVLSGNASPIPNSIKAFKGADIYKVEDIPVIDFLIITHDHWDHLDYETVIKLKNKVGKVFCSLGVGAHLEYWGYEAEKIVELDWYDKVVVDNNLSIHATPGRHFAGRSLKRNTSLWSSFIIESSSKKIFVGGDSGYDTHFKTIGDTYGPFDLVILENGQYNAYWPYIHLMPDKIILAAKELNAKQIVPVHSCKFALANHDWNEPLDVLIENNKTENLNIATPMIGEVLNIGEQNSSSYWWKGLE